MRTSLSLPSWWPGRSREASFSSAAPPNHPRQTLPQDRRITTALLWLLVLACAAFWGWTVWFGRWPWTPPRMPAAAGSAPPLPVLRPPAALARLLGAQDQAAPAPPGPAQRFLVWGVIAGASGGGAALISVDGQAPQPFAVGTELAPGWVLRSVGTREVRLAPSASAPVSLTLPLPEPEASTPAVVAPSNVQPGAQPAGNAPANPAAAPSAVVQQPAVAAPEPPASTEPPPPPVGFRSSRGAPAPSGPP